MSAYSSVSHAIQSKEPTVWHCVCGRLTGDEAREEGLAGEVAIVLFEEFTRRGDQLDGSQFESISEIFSETFLRTQWSFGVDIPTLLKAGDDGSNQATLGVVRTFQRLLEEGIAADCNSLANLPGISYLDTIGLDSDETVQSVSFNDTKGSSSKIWRGKPITLIEMGWAGRTYVCSVDILNVVKN
jgi:hypothetical protein